MYIEKRKSGKNIKYYLVHSYRDVHNKVQKLRKYLGINLTSDRLQVLTEEAKNSILNLLKSIELDVFEFSLTEKQIESLNEYDEKVAIFHFSEKQWQQFTEEFVYNTNAIEGSTIPQEEVHEILKKKKSNDDEEIEAKGVAKAIEYIRKTKQDLSVNLILKLHELCFKGSKHFAGKLRTVEVVIRDRSGEIIHSGTPIENLNKELNELILWYKKNKKLFKPLTLAAIIHNQFEDIHPFQDGNGRVGRLLLNFILVRNKYPPINILLEDRGEYYNTLQEYEQNDKLRPTLNFLIKQYKKTLKKVTTK